jgi:hypothetical protein
MSSYRSPRRWRRCVDEGTTPPFRSHGDTTVTFEVGFTVIDDGNW